jgi:hypothetical protein
MYVEVFLKVAILDISVPFMVVLDGGVAVFPTMTSVDFLPEVCHRVACHRCVMLCRRARIQ